MIVIPVPAPVTGWTVVAVLCNRGSNLEVNPEDFPLSDCAQNFHERKVQPYRTSG